MLPLNLSFVVLTVLLNVLLEISLFLPVCRIRLRFMSRTRQGDFPAVLAVSETRLGVTFILSSLNVLVQNVLMLGDVRGLRAIPPVSPRNASISLPSAVEIVLGSFVTIKVILSFLLISLRQIDMSLSMLIEPVRSLLIRTRTLCFRLSSPCVNRASPNRLDPALRILSSNLRFILKLNVLKSFLET